MSRIQARRSTAFAAVAVAALLASCATPEPEPAPAAPPPPPLPALSLNEGVAQAASIYVAFMREAATIEAGFTSAEAIQAAIRRGASYEPAQLSRGKYLGMEMKKGDLFLFSSKTIPGNEREVLRIGGYTREFFISQTPELAGMADVVIDLEKHVREAALCR